MALRLAHFPLEDDLARDRFLSLTTFVVYGQAQLIWSLISATVPSLRPFLAGFSTHSAGLGGSTTYLSSRYGTSGSGIHLSTLGPSRSSGRPQKSEDNGDTTSRGLTLLETISNIRANGYGNSTLVKTQKEERQTRSVSSSDSQNMIIRKDVAFRVDQENVSGGDDRGI